MSGSYEDTVRHKQLVATILNEIAFELIRRGARHDDSKLISPEKEGFETVASKLSQLTYGSEDYKNSLKDLQPILQHHYLFNSHHPEHHKDGIDGMTLLDVVEMFADWIAATKRVKSGDIAKSIAINKERFKMSDQLATILNNTWNKEDAVHPFCSKFIGD